MKAHPDTNASLTTNVQEDGEAERKRRLRLVEWMRVISLLSYQGGVSSTALNSSFARNRLAFIKLQRTAFALGSKVPHQVLKASGGDTLKGHTRTHPEHDG